MRLMLPAMLLVLGTCLAYAHYLNPPEAAPATYSGTATFVAMTCDHSDDGQSRWLLVCRVDGERIVFAANEAWVRRGAEDLRPGQIVRLCYELPAEVTAHGSTLGPPTLRMIADAGVGGVVVASR